MQTITIRSASVVVAAHSQEYPNCMIKIVTAAGRQLMARIYHPHGAGPFPVLLDLHGGANGIIGTGNVVKATGI